MAVNFIELPENNLYATGQILTFGDGSEALTRQPLAYQPVETDQYYTVQAGDELDGIAYQFYQPLVPQAERFWWVLADVNNIENPLDISGLTGSQLLIPDIFQVLLQLT